MSAIDSTGTGFPGVRRYVELSVGVVAVIVLWEVIVFAGGIKAVVLPAPSDIALETITQFGYYLEHTRVTLIEILVGFVAGILFGFLCGVGIFYVPFLRRGLYPILAGVNQIPKISFAPLLLTWFGSGLVTNTIIALFITFFPMLVNTFVGFAEADEHLLELAELYHVSGFFVFRKIRLPSAMPLIFAALKLGTILAVTGAVVGEFIASSEGLGFILLSASSQIQTTRVFTSILFITVIALLMYLIVVLAERRLLFWYESEAD